MRVAIAILLSVVPFGTIAFCDPPLDWNRLRNGEVICSPASSAGGTSGTQTAFLIAAPADSIWETIADYQRLLTVQGEGHRSRLVRKVKDTTLVEVWTRPLLGKSYHYQLARICEKAGTLLKWRQITGDFSVNEGSWEIRATTSPDTQLIIHHCFVKTRQRITNTFCQLFTAQSMQRCDMRLRHWLENRRRRL